MQEKLFGDSREPNLSFSCYTQIYKTHNMNRYILLLISLLICFKATAVTPTPPPSDANIIGHVVDQATGEHLPGISVFVKGTNIGTATDASGHYFLRHLRPGEVTLVMRGMGYLTQEKKVTVVRNKIVEVNFEAQEDAVAIDEVVVSANRQTTLRRLAPTVVTIVDEKVFGKVNANNLLQGLVFQPGVRVENNCQNCGFNQVRINGLDGRYSQILIDSRPIFSALAGVYGIEQIPTNMVDRVEVVRGGGSALFGSSAIGGVVNIITKEPNGNSFSINESVSFTGMSSPDNNLGMNASLVSPDNRMGAMLYGQARYRTPWDANGDGFSELGKLNARTVGAHFYLKPSDYSKISADIHTIHEDRRGGDHFDLPDHVAAVSEHLGHSIYSGNLKYDLFSRNLKHHFQAFASGQSVDRNSYYGGLADRADELGKEFGKLGAPVPKELYGDNYGVTRGRTYMGGVQYNYSADRLLFMPAEILLGAEYVYDFLDDKMPIRSWQQRKDDKGNDILEGGKLLSAFPGIHQHVHNASQFAQVEWKNQHLSILLGTRLDEHSIVGKPILSPRATLRYNPTKEVNLRASYAKGFRAPQVFDEDLHVSIVGGEAKRVINGEGLRPETSHSFNMSADLYHRWKGISGNLLIEGFYNRIIDVFVNEEQPSQNDGVMRLLRTNSQGARVYGCNIEGKLAWRNLQLQAGFTYTQNLYDKAVEYGEYTEFDPSGMPIIDADKKVQNRKLTDRRMMRTPNAYGYFTLGYEPIHALSFSFTGTITGPMLAPHTIEYGAGSAQSDREAKHDAGIFTEHFKSHGVAPEDRIVRIDELTTTPTFVELGAKVSYHFDIFRHSEIELYGGINNFLDARQKDYDQGASRDSAYIYGPTLPRTLYLGCRLSF